MRYRDLEEDKDYTSETLLFWWGKAELEQRVKDGDLFEIREGIFRRIK